MVQENKVSENLVGDSKLNDRNPSQNVKTTHEPVTDVMFLD